MRIVLAITFGILVLFSPFRPLAKIVMVNDPIDIYPEFTNFSPYQLSDPKKPTQGGSFFLVDVIDQRYFYELLAKSI